MGYNTVRQQGHIFLDSAFIRDIDIIQLRQTVPTHGGARRSSLTHNTRGIPRSRWCSESVSLTWFVIYIVVILYIIQLIFIINQFYDFSRLIVDLDRAFPFLCSAGFLRVSATTSWCVYFFKAVGGLGRPFVIVLLEFNIRLLCLALFFV
jgi:hypothetical protein